MTGRHIVWKSVGHNYRWAAVCQVSVAGDFIVIVLYSDLVAVFVMALS